MLEQQPLQAQALRVDAETRVEVVMQDRTIVVVSDALAYVNGWAMADYRRESPVRARDLMDLFIAKYRNAGWPVVDERAEAAAAA